MADPKPSRRIDLADTARGILVLCGIALVGYGAWLHYPPLGFAAAGGLLVGMGLLAALRAR